MSDQFNVTAAYDKPSYNTGDTMTLTISGGDVLTTTTTSQSSSGTLTLTINAADGATTTVPVTAVPITTTSTVATPESVVISSITDSSGRTWTIANGGLSATAKA